MVDCYGLFRFCRDGRCGRHQGDKCFGDNRLTTAATVLNMTQDDNHLQSGTTGGDPLNYTPVKPISIGINLGNHDDSSNFLGTSSNLAKKVSNVEIHGVDVESNLDITSERPAPVVNVNANE